MQDTWNLYSMLDIETTKCLNICDQQNILGVFKPHVLRTNEDPYVNSDADSEIIAIARFTSPVLPRKLMIIGGGRNSTNGNHPKKLKLYVNQENIDFTNIASYNATEEFDCPINPDGTCELTITNVSQFNNVTCLVFYFCENMSGDEDVSTYVQYIGMQGDHTHYRREPVHADYELFCTHTEIPEPTSSAANTALH